MDGGHSHASHGFSSLSLTVAAPRFKRSRSGGGGDDSFYHHDDDGRLSVSSSVRSAGGASRAPTTVSAAEEYIEYNAAEARGLERPLIDPKDLVRDDDYHGPPYLFRMRDLPMAAVCAYERLMALPILHASSSSSSTSSSSSSSSSSSRTPLPKTGSRSSMSPSPPSTPRSVGGSSGSSGSSSSLITTTTVSDPSFQMQRILRGLQLIVDKHNRSTVQPTHTALNSGCFAVRTVEEEKVFLQTYVTCLLHGFRMFFNEIGTPVFRWFIDFDFQQNEGLTERQVEATVFVVQDVVRKYYPPEQNLTAIVCGTSYKKLSDGRVKTGVHVTWNDVFVTRAQALQLREHILCALNSTIEGFGKRVPPQNKWEDVIDAGVYRKNSNLRMLGSYKIVPCPVCAKVKLAPGEIRLCETCKGRGRVDESRAYMPMFIVGNDGRRDLALEADYMGDPNALLRFVQDTKLRSWYTEKDLGKAPTTTTTTTTTTASSSSSSSVWVRPCPTLRFKIPSSAPRVLDFDLADGRPREPLTKSSLAAQYGLAPRQVDVIHDTDPLAAALESFVQQSFGDHYRHIQVRNVAHSVTKTRGKVYYVNTRGEGCNWCQNVSRNHGSSSIYFEITPEGAAQRCHSPKGTCKSYASRRVPVPAKLAALIFPASGVAPSLADLVVDEALRDIFAPSSSTSSSRVPSSSSASAAPAPTPTRPVVDDDDPLDDGGFAGGGGGDGGAAAATGDDDDDWVSVEDEALRKQLFTTDEEGFLAQSKIEAEIRAIVRALDQLCERLNFPTTMSESLGAAAASLRDPSLPEAPVGALIHATSTLVADYALGARSRRTLDRIGFADAEPAPLTSSSSSSSSSSSNVAPIDDETNPLVLIRKSAQSDDSRLEKELYVVMHKIVGAAFSIRDPEVACHFIETRGLDGLFRPEAKRLAGFTTPSSSVTTVSSSSFSSSSSSLHLSSHASGLSSSVSTSLSLSRSHGGSLALSHMDAVSSSLQFV